MDDTRTLRFFNRGPSAVARLIFFCVFSLLLLFVDSRYQYLGAMRQVLAMVIYPVQRLVDLPGETVGYISDYFVTHNQLLTDNERLLKRHNEDAVQLLQLQMVQAENAQLRTMLEVKQRVDYPLKMAEIIYIDRDLSRRRIIIDKGSQSEVLAGQIVVDDVGIVGQVTRTYPLQSEVTLITDKDHAVPIQVMRNGVRAVVFGTGDVSEMALRYMPISVDIVEGDVLVTSGIDGTYPANLPVAKVLKVERDPEYPFAHIVCAPLAGVDRHRSLLIVSGLPQLPERPAPEAKPETSERAKSRLKRRKS